VPIGKEWVVKPVANGHVSAAGSLVKSLSFILYHVKRKLRPKYAGKAGAEIGRLRKSLGDEVVMQEILEPVLAYSGDTPVEDPARYKGVRILIHEATFLDRDSVAHSNERPNKHSTLPEVIAMAADLDVQCLILGHFSCRFTTEEINAAVRTLCSEYRIAFPVYTVLPAAASTDILSGTPCWPGL
jgi:ribonuclease Z